MKFLVIWYLEPTGDQPLAGILAGPRCHGLRPRRAVPVGSVPMIPLVGSEFLLFFACECSRESPYTRLPFALDIEPSLSGSVHVWVRNS